jgi:hypothetical protein
MQALRSRHASAGIEASRRTLIPSPPAEPSVLVLWINQVSRRFCGELPQTSRADFGREPLPCTGSDRVLLFLPPCGPHLTPLATGSLESGLLVSPLLGGPARQRPFAPTLHLHQHKSSRNLHLQYSAKSQSTPRCQSLITTRSDHPPVLGRSGPQELLREIHADTCGHHAGPRTLVGKAFRQGFYWPLVVVDSKGIVHHCEGCQFYTQQTHLPAQALQTTPITWPFAMWHLDMVGPL